MNLLSCKIPKKVFIDKILEQSPLETIGSSVVFIYKDHIPNVAILLNRGSARMGSQELIVRNDEEPYLFYFEDLLKSRPASEDFLVVAGSEVVIIDKVFARSLLPHTTSV